MLTPKFKVISDSCCDLSREVIAEHDIGIVPLYVAFSDGVYLRDYYDFDYQSFYRRMMDHPGDYPKTSLPSVEDYIKTWEPYIKEGTPVLSISMTSKMSGSVNSARMAKDEILDTYPDAQIEVIDSLALTVLEGVFVLEACRLRDAGKTLSEAAQILNDARSGGRAYFTIGDLSYLSKGGRIGSLVKVAAVGLGLKPVILFKDGNISLSAITRSRQKSLKELARQAALFFSKNHEDPRDYILGVGYGLLREDGVALREMFLEALGEAGASADPALLQIGTMVGAHNGPLLMGIVIFKKLQLA
ncbi:MAG: DegV family protein [Eubacteriales bacterium]|nr:DegV family protein [Eubacteriales bacterium]